MRRLVFAVLTVWFVVGCGGVASGQEAVPVPVCAERGSSLEAIQATLKLIKVNGQATEGPIEVSFGDRRSDREFILEYQVLDCVFAEEEVGRPVTTAQRKPANRDGELLAVTELGGRAVVQDPSLVVVVFKANPSNNRSKPGSFLTGFVVTDKRFTQFQQDLTLNLRYQNTGLLFFTLLIPAVIIGPAAIWVKGKAGGASESLKQWWGKAMNVAAVFAGVAGARAYFGTRVMGNKVFGADLFERNLIGWPITEEWYLVAAGTVSAFITAALAVSILGDAVRGGTDRATSANQGGKFPGRVAVAGRRAGAGDEHA